MDKKKIGIALLLITAVIVTLSLVSGVIAWILTIGIAIGLIGVILVARQ